MNTAYPMHSRLAELLINVEMVMREGGLWECEPPSEQAMQSNVPFCVDTMSFAQWLRYIMVEKFKVLIEHGAPLPKQCHVSPMAVEAFKEMDPTVLKNLVKRLDKIDQHLSSQTLSDNSVS
ncbi:hypothetical protein MSP8886_01770 [Marinomonas spartinae]|uniref:YqcC-like domain-containing protein n=1 Tax=Marinomonas spartinae TaxID=1792290 RepID=A0A1A8TEQ1_9GAMM|nr:YqcC family protein [Marinomonas spartinae]SBS30318.1 hypothetical protein MSP8886_01770 [Marinomonas spartinae]